MSERKQSVSREWRFFLTDMLQFCEQIRQYTVDLDFDTFSAHGISYDATVRKIELLGEAARHIPEDVREMAPGVEWDKIIGVRNILIHGYFGLNDEILWDIVQTKIEPLHEAIEELARKLK